MYQSVRQRCSSGLPSLDPDDEGRAGVTILPEFSHEDEPSIDLETQYSLELFGGCSSKVGDVDFAVYL